ncbi:MAG: DMT family transporter, partial [Bacteroidaceae bacterium]|nr:DMT family transporter [Bacteroidaceae bacterium]
MWLVLAFLSAALLGFYDVCKKYSLRGNAVLPILFLNTLFCSIIFLPLAFQTPFGGWEVQRYILLKACIVLSSWLLGYIGIKHLPITIVGPINATRPMLVLLGALLIFGERLNLWQWAGVMLAILSFCLLSRSGKKEGIDFRHNRWIFCIAGAAILGAISGLYDKYLMTTEGGLGLPRLTVQCWYNFYQAGIMGVMLLLLWWPG